VAFYTKISGLDNIKILSTSLQSYRTNTVAFRNEQHKREVKRQIKRRGKKARRQALKRNLAENPEEADCDAYRFREGESSKELNNSPFDELDYYSFDS
jgi:hypothetical protein